MVYLFLADGFEEIEALTPVDVLKRAGVEIKTVSVGEGLYVEGSHGITVKADMNIDDICNDCAEMLILPGGMPGTLNLENSSKLQSMLDKAYKEEKYLAAICAAPSVLGKNGYLKNKKATCFPGFEKYLTGAEYTGSAVEADGKIITAKGMGKAMEFSLKLTEILKGKEEADRIAASFFA